MSKYMGFECVVRGLRLEKKMRRPEWPDNNYITKTGSNIKLVVKVKESLEYFEYIAPAEDILANDWEIIN